MGTNHLNIQGKSSFWTGSIHQWQLNFAGEFNAANDVHQHGHSLYLNLLGEMGIVGLVATSVFMYFYFRRFRNCFSQSKNKLNLLVIFAFIVSCAVHNIFDSYHTKSAMLWPLAILAGAALAKPYPPTGQQKYPRPWGVLLLIGFAWVAIWALNPYYQGVDLANQNQWDQAFIKFQEAVKRDPGNALAHQQLGLTAAVLAQEGDQDMLDISIQETIATIKYEPAWALNHANLAILYLENDQQDLAIQSAQKAVELAPLVQRCMHSIQDLFWNKQGKLQRQRFRTKKHYRSVLL